MPNLLAEFVFQDIPPTTLDFFLLETFKTKKSWFQASPVGQNSLATFVLKVCKEAGISGRKTNHSLGASGTSAVFSADN